MRDYGYGEVPPGAEINESKQQPCEPLVNDAGHPLVGVRDPKSKVDCEEAHHPGAPGPIEQVSYPVSSGNRGRAWREPQSLTLL